MDLLTQSLFERAWLAGPSLSSIIPYSNLAMERLGALAQASAVEREATLGAEPWLGQLVQLLGSLMRGSQGQDNSQTQDPSSQTQGADGTSHSRGQDGTSHSQENANPTPPSGSQAYHSSGMTAGAPPGYKAITGAVSPGVAAKAKSLLGLPFGQEVPFELDGKRYLARVEHHYHPPGYQGGPNGWHKGVTVYQAA